jgi:probable F420-dependent oxidoreductase
MALRLGAIFPQTEIGSDPGDIRAYAQRVEELGYDHLLTYEHVLGASTASRPDWAGPYTSETMFHEPFVLFGYFAAITSRLELVTSVLILPQRQTVLVAKQAAEVDVLSSGRMRLGIGVGWNDVEYEGLNEDFKNRGARSEEQITLLRALWGNPAITFHGTWHHVNDAGINPLPVRRAIPIWLGGASDRALRRVARLGDGWFPQRPPDADAREQLDRLWRYVAEAGRQREEIGIEPRLSPNSVPEAEWKAFTAAWRDLGATHLCINTMGLGYTSVRQHLDALNRIKQSL